MLGARTREYEPQALPPPWHSRRPVRSGFHWPNQSFARRIVSEPRLVEAVADGDGSVSCLGQ